MIDGICIMHSLSTYMFHLFMTPLFNDRDISQRLNCIRLKINKQQMLKKKIEKDQITLYPKFSFLNPALKEQCEQIIMEECTESIGSSCLGGNVSNNTSSQHQLSKEQILQQKVKNIDLLPREGIILIPIEDQPYFGTNPKMIFWREFQGVIVSLIGDCEDVNLAN